MFCGYRDSWGRRCTQVVAIDALTVKYHLNQFEDKPVSRELNKAYVGFYDPYNQHIRTAIATGNWGCGAFGGDLRLKALIQLMAAAAAGRDVCYFTYKDDTLTQDIYDIHQLITDRGLTVGDAWCLIHDYSRSYRSARSHDKAATQKNVFEFFQVRVTKHKHNTNSASDKENEDSDYNNDSASDEENEDSRNNNDSASDEENEDSHNNNDSASDEENEGTWYHGDISSGDIENEDTWIQVGIVNPDEVTVVLNEDDKENGALMIRGNSDDKENGALMIRGNSDDKDKKTSAMCTVA
ncbi:hypothetical protein LSAT2_002945 [Lamellibrachia satsuma]|nr:hypothetical protein LSAT2_002945 [Lamellibrachia satsuma]